MNGFRQNRSAIDNIIALVSSLEEELNSGHIPTAVFLDIKSAFDSVYHDAILASLIALGLGGRLYAWIANYLDGRKLFMCTEEGPTPCYDVNRGVPQGAVLSPLLFNLTLIHLKRVLPRGVKVTLYADDICVWSASRSRRITQQKLQKALSRIAAYLSPRGLHLSSEKSVAMAFTRKRMDRYPLILSGRPLQYVRTQRYLGIVIDRNLSWSPEVQRLRSRILAASQIIGYLCGTRWGSDCRSAVLLFKAYVDGILRYSLPVLQTLSPTSRKQLEAARNNCLRKCLGLPAGSSCCGTLAEAGCLPMDVLRLQETLRNYLRYRLHATTHFLARSADQDASSFGRTIRAIDASVPNQAPQTMPLGFPPWILSPVTIKHSIPGID